MVKLLLMFWLLLHGMNSQVTTLIPKSDSYVFVAADFTTASNTSLQNITGLTFILPANVATKVPFFCELNYSQAVAAAAVAFGIQDVTVAPTNLKISGTIATSTTASTIGNVNITTTTATVIVSAIPSTPLTTIWYARLSGFIEQPSNASASVLNIMVSQATAADLVTIKRGSFCRVF